MLDIYLLSVLAVFGAVAAYQDIAKSKVGNKLILSGLLAGAAGYLCSAIQAVLSPSTSLIYFKPFLINILISWSASFVIWYCGMWSAGDAKVFMLFTFLFPLDYYGARRMIPFFPAANLLGCIFIFLLFFIISEMVFNILRSGLRLIVRRAGTNKGCREPLFSWDWKSLIETVKEDKRIYAKIMLAYLCFFLLIGIIKAHAANFSGLGNFSYLLMFVIFRPLKRILAKVGVVWLCVLLGAMLLYRYVFVHSGIKEFFVNYIFMIRNYGLFMLSLLVFSTIAEIYFGKKEEVRINTGDLRAGMVLSAGSAGLISRHLKAQGIEEKFYPDGLLAEQVLRIKDVGLKNNICDIGISRTFPLVPFFFFGAAATAVAAALQRAGFLK